MLKVVHSHFKFKTIESLTLAGFKEGSPDDVIISALLEKDKKDIVWKDFKTGVKQILSSCKNPVPGEDLMINFLDTKINISFPSEYELKMHYLLMDAIEVIPQLNYIDFIFIFSSLLFERTLIFVSESRRLLGNAIQFFTSIISPLNWPFPVIYSLPENCLEILSSPVPLISGLLAPGKKVINEIVPEYASMTKDIIYVFLDHQVLLAGKETASQTIMPRFNKQIQNLHHSIKNYFANTGSHSINFNSKSREFSRKSIVKLPKMNSISPSRKRVEPSLASSLKVYLNELRKIILSNLGTKDVDDWKLAESEIRQRLGPKDDKFLDVFFQTQTFAFSLPNLKSEDS